MCNDNFLILSSISFLIPTRIVLIFSSVYSGILILTISFIRLVLIRSCRICAIVFSLIGIVQCSICWGFALVIGCCCRHCNDTRIQGCRNVWAQTPYKTQPSHTPPYSYPNSYLSPSYVSWKIYTARTKN